jgi:hypothetical protein
MELDQGTAAKAQVLVQYDTQLALQTTVCSAFVLQVLFVITTCNSS